VSDIGTSEADLIYLLRQSLVPGELEWQQLFWLILAQASASSVLNANSMQQGSTANRI
jgi:hypothetical protein